MNFSSILTLILSNPEKINDTIKVISSFFKATTAATPVVVSPQPIDEDKGATAVEQKPNETVKKIQALLNEFVKPSPQLRVDGWWGPKTEIAINNAIKMAEPYMQYLR